MKYLCVKNRQQSWTFIPEKKKSIKMTVFTLTLILFKLPSLDNVHCFKKRGLEL